MIFTCSRRGYICICNALNEKCIIQCRFCDKIIYESIKSNSSRIINQILGGKPVRANAVIGAQIILHIFTIISLNKE